MTLADQSLAKDMDSVMGQIRGQVEDVKNHGYGQILVIVRGGNVTTVHVQKTWVRKDANNGHNHA